ncbi:cyanobactin biosynthesis protein (PatB/AcyB/McaB family) [Lipingzhangella halophila]|uniref:Cyanobactin biosynthesis protein (PatB/AcyB/McaB family) n=1 Tax=Lipingzhangella halophila TaxID=1783352 RepID=A0A7W7RIY1_9ACTN|nr:hypothetical protein [Lipingzhangella halophila]MBB4932830.1 cyanobactin biosynthesis protein (PatB/AcyB/McaB family) [Lipingzhangella halophila]
MGFPKQAHPVRRPELVEPDAALAPVGSAPSATDRVREHPAYSANYNDPPSYAPPGYQQMSLSAPFSG